MPDKSPILTPELREKILRPYLNKPAALARVERYLQQPQITAYVVQLNAAHEADPVYGRTTNCYSHAMGVTLQQFNLLGEANDDRLENRRCLQPGMLGGLRDLHATKMLPIPQKRAYEVITKMQQRLHESLQRDSAKADRRRVRVARKGLNLQPTESMRKRLYLLSDGLIETTIAAPVPSDMRRIFTCTGLDERHDGSNYHAFLEEPQPLTVTQRRDGKMVTSALTVWSHKNGIGGEVSIFGPDGRIITDPRKAVGSRETLLGFFLRPAEPLPITDTTFEAKVALEHADELRKGAQRIARAAMINIYILERRTGAVGDRDAHRRAVNRFCEQHGFQPFYIGGPTPPKKKQRRRPKTDHRPE